MKLRLNHHQESLWPTGAVWTVCVCGLCVCVAVCVCGCVWTVCGCVYKPPKYVSFNLRHLRMALNPDSERVVQA